MGDGYPNGPISLSSPPEATDGQPATPAEGPFATADDLEKRWHALTSAEKAKAEALLEDAAALIRSTCPNWSRADGSVLRFVSCAAVKRAMLANDDTAGVSQHTETAGSYSESYSYSNPAGDLYLTQSDKEALGGDGTTWAYELGGHR